MESSRAGMGAFRHALAGILVAAAAATTWAQDYTATTATGLLEARPPGASALHVPGGSAGGSFGGASVALPFQFPYYGETVESLWVTAFGFVLPDSSGGFLNQHLNFNGPGRDATTDAFPYTPQGVNGSFSPNADGVIAAFWENFTIYSGNPVVGDTYWWTIGAAPQRRFVVSWESFQAGNSVNPRTTAQMHLYESTGRIVFAYDATGGYASTRYVCGIDSPADSRYTAPRLPSNQNTGYPGSDFVFDPRTVTFSGRLLFDKLVSVGSSRVDLQACKLEYSIVSPK